MIAGDIRQYDHVIGRIKDIIERKAPRPYDLLQRYGYSLKDFVQRY